MQCIRNWSRDDAPRLCSAATNSALQNQTVDEEKRCPKTLNVVRPSAGKRAQRKWICMEFRPDPNCSVLPKGPRSPSTGDEGSPGGSRSAKRSSPNCTCWGKRLLLRLAIPFFRPSLIEFLKNAIQNSWNNKGEKQQNTLTFGILPSGFIPAKCRNFFNNNKN